jgi:hypothetical protein
MARLQSRDIIRIAATAVPIIACATLISLGVMPQFAALWWGLLHRFSHPEHRRVAPYGARRLTAQHAR